MRLSDIRFNALRSALYHAERERFFDSRNRWLTFFSIVFGSAAAGSLAADSPEIGIFLIVSSALTSAVSLAFDPSGNALEHAYLRRRFYELLSDVEGLNEDEDVDIKGELSARLMLLFGEERPHMHAVNLIAWNEAADAIHGIGVKERIKISRWCRVTKNILRHSGLEIKTEKAGDKNGGS
ncbi:MAG: hypothetical protein AAGD47_09820 [Pseudomonadota bacterium]